MATSPIQQTTAHGTAVTSLAFPAITVTKGDALIATIAGNASGSTISVSDDQSNNWQKAVAVIGAAGVNDAEIWYALNAKAGSTTVTVSNGIVAANFSVNLTEWPSLLAVDGTNSNFAPGTSPTNSPSTNAVATTNPNDLMVAVMSAGGVFTITAGPTNSFTALTPPATNTAPIYGGAYQVETAIGSYSTGWTLSAVDTWSAVIAAFVIQTNTGLRTTRQRRRVPHIKAKKPLRSNLARQLIPSAPVPFRSPILPHNFRIQKKRVYRVISKKWFNLSKVFTGLTVTGLSSQTIVVINT